MITSPRQLIVTVSIIILAFFALLWANERWSAYISARESSAEAEWKKQVEIAAKTHTRIIASLQRDSAASRAIDSARSIARSAISEANRIRTIRVSVPVPAVTDSTNPKWQKLYGFAVIEIDSLRSVHRADSTALGTALWARDSLRAVLLAADTSLIALPKSGNQVIAAKTCKVLWLIACPSRRVVAVASAVGGALAGAYVARQRLKH